MIRTFRPWQLFEHLGMDNDLHIKIPTVPGTTSRTVFMLETALLVAAARIVKARTILEIGTCMGYTAMNLAINTDAKITSWDIDHRPQIWEGTEWEDRITYRMVPQKRNRIKQFDMVFVDANHDYNHVKADTLKAFKMDPRCVVWHDYNNPMEPGVMKYLSELAQTHNLIHVQDSWLCFWFKEDLK